MSRVIPITSALAAMLAVAPGVAAQVTSSQDTARSPWHTPTPTFGSGSDADSASIRLALRGNFTEVALARLVDSRASSSDVKEFAGQMIADHNSLNEKWADLARESKMKVSPDFGPSGEQTIDRLDNLSGSAFDQAYMSEMIRDHEQDLSSFERMASSARSSEVRELAGEEASTIRQHLALARQVGGRVGVSSTAARAAGVPVPAPTTSSNDDRRTTNNPSTAKNRSALGAGDRSFVDRALSDHLMHIRLAKRAEREAKSEQTRDLAERIEKDLTRWSVRWEDFADRRDAEVSSKLSPHGREKLERLDNASERGDLDRVYGEVVAEHLELMIQYFRDRGRESQTPAVRNLVQGEVPVLRDLQDRARKLENEMSKRAKESDRK